MILACEIYNNFSHIDEVWIVPCGDGRKDKKLRCNAYNRIKMLSLIRNDVVYPDLPVNIELTEYNNKKFMPTYDLLKKLKNDYSTYNFSFCLGSDLLVSLPKWEYGMDIINEYELIIMHRPGYEIKNLNLLKKYHILESTLDNSSTKIRNRIEEVINKKHKVYLGISGLTSRSVIQYIIENELYNSK